MDIECGNCGHTYEVRNVEDLADDADCPECGFGPDQCNHPVEERDSDMMYDVEAGRNVEVVRCGKCGQLMG